MFYAKAMYLGGAIVVCSEEQDYLSYKIRGLCCIECGEEVQLKNGESKRPHFAHFMDVGLIQTKCSLRVSSDSGSWSCLTSEGKGQRRKLFQEHFMSMIKSQDASFDQNIQRIKNKITSNILEKITTVCFEFFVKKKRDLIVECRTFSDTANKAKWMNILIASEAIDYLSIPSSRDLLEQLLHYSIYLACDKSCSKDWNIYISKIEPNSICEILKETLLKTNWFSAFEQLNQNNTVIPPVDSSLNFQDNELMEKLAKSVSKYIYLDGSSLEFKYEHSNNPKKQLKLKLVNLNIDLYTFQKLPKALFAGIQPERQGYKYFKTIANIINLEEKANDQEIIITYKLIYHKYMGFTKEVFEFYQTLVTTNLLEDLISKGKKTKKKISFILANWEEIKEIDWY